MVRRRLDADERRCIKSGDVFVWEERCNAEASGVGMQTSHLIHLSYNKYPSSWALSDGRIQSVGVPVAREM